METVNVFLTYNSSSEAEKSTALRLQTVAHLYGLTVTLPYRPSGIYNLNEETKNRINRSIWIVAFCTTRLTNVLKEELNYALSKNKKIIIIYDKQKGKKINFKSQSENILEVYMDFNNPEESIQSIASYLKNKIKEKKHVERENDTSILTGLLAIGLGMLAVWYLSRKN